MSNNVVVCALYKFAVLNDYKSLRQPLLDLMLEKDVHGTLLLAREGINGTIAGSREGIDAVKAWIASDEALITKSPLWTSSHLNAPK